MSDVVIATFGSDPSRLVRYLGPYQIAWWIRENSYNCQVLDFLYFFTKDQRHQLYKKYILPETKIIGFAPFITTKSNQNYSNGKNLVYEILAELKEHAPWAKIVLGGWFAHDVILTDPTLDHHSAYYLSKIKIDALFLGEGENSFLEYVKYVLEKKPHPPFTITNGYKVIKTTNPFDIQGCRMVYAKNDFILPGESVPMEFSRGCIFKCNFCQYPNIGKDKDDFNKSIDLIEEALISNYENCGITRYHMADDTFNSHRERTKSFHNIVQHLPFDLEYIAYIRMDLLDIWPEQLEILPESGLTSCQFGVESLNSESCKQIGKGWGAKNHKKWLSKLDNEWGDKVIRACSLIAGLGKETEEDWEATHEWFLESGTHDWFYQPLFLSGALNQSVFEKNATEYGYKIENDYHWTAEHTTFMKAKVWSDWQRNSSWHLRTPAVWNMMALMNVGFTREEILNSNYRDLHIKRREEERTKKYILDYYNAAINY
jgi:hypothetical protein